MLFETIVSSSAAELSTSASMSVSGAPTSPKPPTITVSPDRIAATASLGSTGPLVLGISRVPFVGSVGSLTALVCMRRWPRDALAEPLGVSALAQSSEHWRRQGYRTHWR